MDYQIGDTIIFKNKKWFVRGYHKNKDMLIIAPIKYRLATLTDGRILDGIHVKLAVLDDCQHCSKLYADSLYNVKSCNITKLNNRS